jgi:DNA-directed RNA polymerase specialized sigma24 family protein
MHAPVVEPLDAGSTCLPIERVVVRTDLYPRSRHDPALVQRYAENIENLPPIEVNQYGHLIDGYHRYLAYRLREKTEIPVIVTETSSDEELLALAAQRNAAHGWQLTDEDKKYVAVRLYGAGTGRKKEEIAKILSVSLRTVNRWLSDIDREIEERRRQTIFEMWLACASHEEIAEVVGLDRTTVLKRIKDTCNLDTCPKITYLKAVFSDEGWNPPLYNIWTFAKKTNVVDHFGNSEQRILENLLYLYTEPFDIVVDPFAGGGATIDVCRERLRRYWVSDRKPTAARGDKYADRIRAHDVTKGIPPLGSRWREVSLTFLDPPYWKQAEGKYSNDPEDLANMPLDQFTETLVNLIHRIADVQGRGAIALLMQPTQWNAPNRQFIDHVMDIVSSVRHPRLVLDNRISVPYSTEQYKPQQVEWAREHKKLLVLTRECIVWRIEASRS